MLPGEDEEDWVEARAFLAEVAVSNVKDVAKSFTLPLESLLQVTDSSFCLTMDEEDKKYGPLSVHLMEVAEFKVRACLYNVWVMVDEERHPNVDLVWDGWDAAYIMSKRLQSEQATAPDVLGKRKLWEYIPDEEGEEKTNDSVYEKEFAVTLIAYEALERYCWGPLEMILGKSANDAIKNRIFEFYVKLILTVYDEDDFKRIFHRQQLFDEYLALCGDILQMGLFAAVDKWKSKSNAFSYLMESDLYEAVQRFYMFKKKHVDLMVPEFSEERKRAEVIEHFKPKAFELIHQHKPLKRDLKAQLILELTRLKCYHVTDVLILEGINALKLPELFSGYMSGKSVGDTDELNELLCSLADSVLEVANALCTMKAAMLTRTEIHFIIPLWEELGPCKDEVTHVLRIANYERVMQNERFISPAHILVGLCLSRVAEFFQGEMIHSLVNSSSRSCSAFYTYMLYQLSWSLAKELDDEEVGLEHLVFAMVYGSSNGNLKDLATQPPGMTYFIGLRECRTKCCVQGWRNADVFTTVMEKRCRAREMLPLKGRDLVVKLSKDIENGRLKLPGAEVLRAPCSMHKRAEKIPNFALLLQE